PTSFIFPYTTLFRSKEDTYLFKHGFFDENILALKVDSNEEYAVFVNENKYEGELNSIERVLEFLEYKYLNNSNIVTNINQTNDLDRKSTRLNSSHVK